MMYILRTVMFLLIFVFISSNLQGQKKTYITKKIEGEKPVIDGVINDAIWNSVEWGNQFIQLEPYENKPPSQQTQFKILYDNDNLYVAVQAYDSSPDSIVRRLSRRDHFEGDWVAVIIDSYHDLQTAFSFIMNAAGVKGDRAVTNNGGNRDHSWDPIWYGKTSINALGWTVEMKIPLTQLRFAKQDNYVWGLQVSRGFYRNDERSSWQFIPQDAGGFVHLFGELHGIRGIHPKKQKDITPYVVSAVEYYEKDDENPFKMDGKGKWLNAGLDAKIGITNNLTMDLTINPDFGQVEADPSEVNLTAFETFFSEKRPFFIEGRNIMDFRLTLGGSPFSRDNLFYSRRIGRKPQYYPDIDADDVYSDRPNNTTILGAAKVTGKTKNGWSIGLLESVTQKEIAEFDTIGGKRFDKVVEPLSNYFLARAQKDMNEGNTRLGGMITSVNRQLITPELNNEFNSEAYTGGIDFMHQWKDKTYYVTFNTSLSHVKGTENAILNLQESSRRYYQRPDIDYVEIDSSRTSLTGTGGYIQHGKNGKGHIRYLIWLTWRSPGFETNDMGYLRSADNILEVAWLQYRIWEPFSIFRSFSFNINQWLGWDFGGTNLYKGFETNYHFSFKNFWEFGNGFSYEFESKDRSVMRGGPYFTWPKAFHTFYYVETDERKQLGFDFFGAHGIGWENSYTNNEYGLAITYRPAPAFKITLNPHLSISESEIAHVENVDYNNEKRYVRAKLNRQETNLTVRLNYTITPDLTIQFYGQPFISAGNYSDFKLITSPDAEEFKNRYTSFSLPQIAYNKSDEIFEVDEDTDGIIDYTFDEPNFNRYDFNFNLVGRWEFKPGSVIYLVWSQNRGGSDARGSFRFKDDVNELFDFHPHDIFLVKFSYRFGL